jgi:hypothetical protein
VFALPKLGVAAMHLVSGRKTNQIDPFCREARGRDIPRSGSIRWPRLELGQTFVVNGTLIVAVVALAVSIASAMFQIVQWIFSGARVTVFSDTAIILGIEPPGPNARSCVTLTVRNRGRSSAWVSYWGHTFVNSNFGVVPGWTKGPDLPCKIEAGASAVWMADYQEARSLTAQHQGTARHYWETRPFAMLATGKKQVGRHSLILYEPGYAGPNRWPRKRILSTRKRLIAAKVPEARIPQ